MTNGFTVPEKEKLQYQEETVSYGLQKKKPDTFYEWYKKLVALKGGSTTITEDVYNRNPLDAWTTMLGLKPAPLTQNIKERGQAAREAAEKSDALLRARGGR